MDSLLTRSLLALAIGVALILAGILLDPVLAVIERIRH